MRLLTLNHSDFKIHIENSHFEDIFNKANRNVGEKGLQTSYRWTDGVESVLYCEDGEKTEIIQDSLAPVVFFDNADYAVWVDFKDSKKPSTASFKTALKKVEDRFSYHKDKGTLSGIINYGNDIGRSDLCLTYELGGEKKSFRLFFEVLSTKLDYHDHWKKIVKDVECEYRMLAIDFLKKTYHSFADTHTGKTLDVIWWNLFKQVQDEFVKATKRILSKPRHRVHPHVQYLRADKLKYLTPRLENALIEHKGNESYRYRTETSIVSHDTPENRFVKFALQFIAGKHDVLAERVKRMKGVSEVHKNEISLIQRTLKQLTANSFFRTVGKFTSLSQGSLVLQRATGYNTIYRTWSILKAAYSLNDGMYSLETKDIATLYEIWCFIEMKNIVKELLGVEPDNLNRSDMSKMFTCSFDESKQSKILFKKDGVELVGLFYNQKTENEAESFKMNDIVSKTVPQRPDIILQLTKKFSRTNISLTYLFDAKYRIDRKEDGVDVPPDDAINQMHRYRDALYYSDPRGLKKEVIGGYILYPGTGECLSVQKANFYKSIKAVNIGAFPLRPKDVDNRELLKNFVNKLIKYEPKEHLCETIPQKGTKIKIENVSDDEVFLRDKPVKGLQAWSVANKVYLCHESKVKGDPRLVEWIPLSISDSPVRLLKVMGYLEKLSLEDFKLKYPSWDQLRDSEKDLDPGMYYLWNIEEVK